MALGPEIYDTPAAGSPRDRRLFVFNGGFITNRRVRRILQLSGYSLHLGMPRDGDAIAVWGNAGTAHRGLAVASKKGYPLSASKTRCCGRCFPVAQASRRWGS